MPCFYLNPNTVNQTSELQVCIAEALYNIESILANPGALTTKETRTVRDFFRRDESDDYMDEILQLPPRPTYC